MLDFIPEPELFGQFGRKSIYRQGRSSPAPSSTESYSVPDWSGNKASCRARPFPFRPWHTSEPVSKVGRLDDRAAGAGSFHCKMSNYCRNCNSAQLCSPNFHTSLSEIPSTFTSNSLYRMPNLAPEKGAMDGPRATLAGFRASKPKSRTGCITCKLRRVKCDETKPQCRRCTKFGRVCEGYPDRVMRLTTASDYLPVIHQPAATLSFRSEQEYRYFGMFRESMVPLLSSYFNSSLWDRLVLQACESNPSIRHAIVAIAALNRTEELARSPPVGGIVREMSSARAHYKYALRQYGRAIKSMQHRVYGKDDLRITLLSCIVITCFETLHGNYYVALRQIIIGHGLLKGRFENRISEKPKQLGIEEDLVQAFGFLAKQANFSKDTQASGRYKSLRKFGRVRLGLMPQEFQTLDDAKMYLKLITQRVTHFMTSVIPALSLGSVKFADSLRIPKEYTAERDLLLGELRSWHTSFTPLLKSAREGSDEEHLLEAMIFQLTYHKYYFITAAVPDTGHEFADPDRFVPLFNQILAAAREVLERVSRSSTTRSFDFEIQVTGPLYAVAHNCPDPVLRKEAQELVLPWKQSEEFVDSMASGQLTDWIRLMALANWARSQDEGGFAVGDSSEFLKIGGIDLLNFC